MVSQGLSSVEQGSKYLVNVVATYRVIVSTDRIIIE
jgi:hypothetical protein